MRSFDRFLYEEAKTDAQNLRDTFETHLDDALDDLVEFNMLSISAARAIRAAFEWVDGHAWTSSSANLVCTSCGTYADPNVEQPDGPCYGLKARLKLAAAENTQLDR